MKLSHISLLAGLLLSTPSWALSTDTEQPIHINSNSQSFDMQSNQVIFLGKVTLKQGSIEIFADKLVVTRPQGKEGRETLEAYGKPARFSQLTDDGKTLKGESNKLHYELEKEFLKMEGNAQLTQDDSVIKGNVITYNMQNQRLIADGDKNERVTTILQPSQLNNK